jgi:CDP-diacylglycerol--glycerol-3-phosphate 3-phosphatidyltransferase
VTPDPQLQAGYTLEWPSSNSALSPLEAPSKYIEQAAKLLTPLIQPQAILSKPKAGEEPNTVIYPLSQFTPFFPSSPKSDASTELPALTSILSILQSPAYHTSSWTFTAGYFNPSPQLTTLLLRTASTNNTVITASPWANGFFGSKGVSGLLPAAYTLLARRFLERAEKEGRKGDVTLKEWRRGTVGVADGWTYHAKGLWISLNGEREPTMSVVGSSNYTKRSYTLDLETGVLIVTRDDALKKKLREERDNLGREWAKNVTVDDFTSTERRVSIKVRIAMWIVGLVGGAL